MSKEKVTSPEEARVELDSALELTLGRLVLSTKERNALNCLKLFVQSATAEEMTRMASFLAIP